MFDLITKLADTTLQDDHLPHSRDDLISKGEFKKVVYFEFVGDKMFRMQILMDLYVIGKTMSKEQGILQLFKMCDRLFHGFLNKMNWLLSMCLGWVPTIESFSLNSLNETFQKLECWHNIQLDEKFPNVCYSLDSDHLFSYMFSILLCILIPIQENQFNQFLVVSFSKFNRCLELKTNDHLLQLYIELLCPPYELIEQYRQVLNMNNVFEKELLNSIEYNAFANGTLKEMCYYFLSIIKKTINQNTISFQ